MKRIVVVLGQMIEKEDDNSIVRRLPFSIAAGDSLKAVWPAIEELTSETYEDAEKHFEETKVLILHCMIEDKESAKFIVIVNEEDFYETDN